MKNIILATDSYKQSHFLQYPPEARTISAYIEARPNSFAREVLFLGLQAFLIELQENPVTLRQVSNAEYLAKGHGVPFNLEGWLRIVQEHRGQLPIEIEALPEGSIVPTGVPLIQVRNTDPTMPWLATFIETALLRAIWYPTTVGTLSRMCKLIIKAGLERTSDDPEGQLPFKLHDFGARGVSSAESAAIGGFAHLVNFQGSDTMEALEFARTYYKATMPGYSIPAAEHSTITSWSPAREIDAYRNMLQRFDRPGGLMAVVSDSYDLDNAVQNIWGGALKAEIEKLEGALVIRPDSGDPVQTPLRTVETLWNIFGGSTNSKGYRVLSPKIRVIQGDGMTVETIAQLVDALIAKGFSIDNIAFGMGGGLLQHVNRDTLRFAMKANAMQDQNGQWHDVSKRPATDPSKASKAGRQAVVRGEDGILQAIQLTAETHAKNLLQPVWRDGSLLVRDDLETIRRRAA